MAGVGMAGLIGNEWSLISNRWWRVCARVAGGVGSNRITIIRQALA